MSFSIIMDIIKRVAINLALFLCQVVKNSVNVVVIHLW